MVQPPRVEGMPEQAASLLNVCKAGKPIYIMTHDHPDPDAMASAAAIHHFIKHHLDLRSKIVYSGLVQRPENRAMMAYLRTKLSSLPPGLFARRITLIMVDTQPGAGNNPAPRGFRPAAVLDHHPLRKETKSCPFFDVQPDLGACATLVTGYLESTGVEIPRTLATALCYAITSETRDLGREAAEEDIDTYVRLLRSANLRRLSRIEHSRVPKEYFFSLHAALEKAFVYRDVIGACLGKVPHPDQTAQFADLLLTHERMQWSACTAIYKDRLFISIRTTRPKAKCGKLLRLILGKEGSAGGHGMIAGGYLPLGGKADDEAAAMEKRLMRELVRLLAPPGAETLPPLMGGRAETAPRDR